MGNALDGVVLIIAIICIPGAIVSYFLGFNKLALQLGIIGFSAAFGLITGVVAMYLDERKEHSHND